MKSLGLSVIFFFVATDAFGDEAPPVPKTPAAVDELILVRPFKLEKGYKFDWGKEQRVINLGFIVVLKVDPALVYPRNAAEPVLYAGDRTVQRLNRGHESGRVIGIIPGDVEAPVNLNLENTPIWFGRPELPERVTTQMIRAERAMADEAQIKPFGADRIKEVTQEPIQAADLSSLLRDHVARILIEFSPQEKNLAETWRLPVARSNPKPR